MEKLVAKSDNTGLQIFDSVTHLRKNPVRHKETVRIGCGAGFGGDRPTAALRLVEKIPDMDYLVLECLAERTLALRYDSMISGGLGYDPRVSEWMSVLLPATVKNGICIITNMGAVDVFGAREEVVKVAKMFSLSITVAVAYEVFETHTESGTLPSLSNCKPQATSTYLGAAPIVSILEESRPNVIITTRLADAALFLGPMVYELGWNWDNFDELSQGILAGHLLECGCQLTGGYYMHPADQHRKVCLQKILDLSLPIADISFDGSLSLSKAINSGGEISIHTCAQQLLYEVGDPSAYITPDVIVDFSNVSFLPLSADTVLAKGALPSTNQYPEKLLQLAHNECGWKGWGEISYGGKGCIERASAADYLVRSWMEEEMPGLQGCVVSYIIGLNSLWTDPSDLFRHEYFTSRTTDIRLRMDGLFELKSNAIRFTKLFEALYTNGPGGGGGISTGYKKETSLSKQLVSRDQVLWSFSIESVEVLKNSSEHVKGLCTSPSKDYQHLDRQQKSTMCTVFSGPFLDVSMKPAIGGKSIPLYEVAHCRAGDKGNDLNFSLIPYFPDDIKRLKKVVTTDWVAQVMKKLTFSCSPADMLQYVEGTYHEKMQEYCEGNTKSRSESKQIQVEIYEVRGIMSLNIVVRNILDGGVNCSRRIDRHGKTISDLILCQEIILPP